MDDMHNTHRTMSYVQHRTQTCTCTYTYTHTYTPTHPHTPHLHTYTPTHTDTHARTHARTHTHIHTYMVQWRKLYLFWWQSFISERPLYRVQIMRSHGNKSPPPMKTSTALHLHIYMYQQGITIKINNKPAQLPVQSPCCMAVV